ncbi:MAG TPA: MFS transporter, partial [Candidatus Binataceae bacterium]
MIEPEPQPRTMLSIAGYGRGFWLVFLATFAINSASNLFVLFPLFVVRLGATAAMIGAIVGTGSLAALAVRPGVGVLIDRIGQRRAAMLLLACDALAILLYIPLHRIGVSMFIVRAIHGAIEGTARVALFAMVYGLLPVERAGQAMAIFSICGMGSEAFAPLVGEAIIRRWGFNVFFLVAAGLTAFAACITRLLPIDREIRRHDKPIDDCANPSYAALLRDPGLMPLWAATLAFALALSSRFSFVAPYGYQQGIVRVGWYFAIYSGIGVMVRLFGGRLLDRIGTERMVFPSLLLFAIGIGLIAGTGRMGLMYLAAMIG